MSVTVEFRALAERIVDDLLEADPAMATSMGDHRFDHLLPDLTSPGVARVVRALDDHITELDAIDDVELEVGDLADLEILRARLLRARFELADLRRHTWDPMVWNPGTALYLLVSRDFAPAQERAASLRARVGLIPDLLSQATGQLAEMSGIHVETALAQLDGTGRLLATEVRALVADDAAVEAAVTAVDSFSAWLGERRASATRDPRLGERLYAGALWHALDDDTSASTLLRDALDHLDVLTARLAQTARDYLGPSARGTDAEVTRMALDDVARRAPVSDDTVMSLMGEALEQSIGFVREHDLVTVPELDIRMIDMPPIHRGVAVAYCDAPGPLEVADVPTYVAVAPTPHDWDEARIASFYREYNGIQLHGLAVHEAMPGHVLQLAHARTLQTPTRVRRFGRSGVFVEGWAVYAEELMTDRGYAPANADRGALAMRLQQLKMQARGVINAILDVSVHAHGMAEAEALALMQERGFQEEGEAVGKWRRALLTAGQLPTYYAGYRAMSRIVGDLRVLHEDWTDRRVHDLVLAHGSPAPRHLRTLLGI